MQLGDLKVGQKARIIALSNDKSVYRQKLIAMGLLPGTTFTLARIGPLGDPLEIHLRGTALSLRKKEAAILKIEVIA